MYSVYIYTKPIYLFAYLFIYLHFIYIYAINQLLAKCSTSTIGGVSFYLFFECAMGTSVDHVMWLAIWVDFAC